MKAYIETYGCTANHADSSAMRDALIASGWELESFPEAADIIIINTCAVTGFTARAMLKKISRYRGKRVIVAGCLPAAEPSLLKDIEHATGAGPGPLIKLLGLRSVDKVPVTIKDGTSIIPISEGCAGECSYCVVRLVRGPLKSYPAEEILDAAKKSIQAGAKELFITSQDVGAYGLDGGPRLPELLNKLAGISGDIMIRPGMMNPFSVSGIIDGMTKAFNHPRVYRFAHIPVQSGSDRILGLMRRPYAMREYEEIIRLLKEAVPGITFSTDYIVGFPTETDEDFNLSMDSLGRVRPLKVNITRYSPRPGTLASMMPDTLERTKKERSRKMTALHHEITSSFMRSMIGSRREVMVTEVKKAGSVVCRDAAYNMVVIKEDMPVGARLEVEVTGAGITYMLAKRLRNI